MLRTFLFVFAVAGAVALPSHVQKFVKGTPSVGVAHQFDWLTEKWTGDERPYRKIHDDIRCDYNDIVTKGDGYDGHGYRGEVINKTSTLACAPRVQGFYELSLAGTGEF